MTQTELVEKAHRAQGVGAHVEIERLKPNMVLKNWRKLQSHGEAKRPREDSMSAFVVEDKTINRIVTLLRTDRDLDHIRKTLAAHGYDLSTDVGTTALARDMFQLNLKAVEQRYEEPATWCRPLDFVPAWVDVSAIQAYKSLRCWHYQCCEGDVPELSPLYSVMEEVADQLARHIVGNLEAYKKASWD